MEFRRTSKWWQHARPEVLGKTEFLKDPKNRDPRYFLEHHYRLDTGKLIKLEPFQLEILDGIYPKDGSPRKFDLALVGLARKQGKTELFSGLLLFHLLFDLPEGGAEVVTVSGDLDQARISFKRVKKAIRRSPEISEVCRVLKDLIEVPVLDSTFEALSADVETSYGKNPSAILLDEFATSSWDLWVALVTGMGAREARGQQPISFLIGTAGWDLTSEFYKLYERCSRGEQDSSTFFYWRNDCPASFTSPKFIERMKKRLRPEQFQRFLENRWVQGAGSFVTQGDIERCVDGSLSPQHQGRPGHVHGIEDKIFLDRLEVWQGQPGNEVMIEDIEQFIRRSCKDFDILSVVCDPWQMKSTVQRLKAESIPIKEWNFTSSSIAKLTSNLYYLIHNGLLKFWRDPDLIGEFLSIQAVQKSYGIRIDHRSGQFSDRVIALGMACHALSELQEEEESGGEPLVEIGNWGPYGDERPDEPLPPWIIRWGKKDKDELEDLF